MTWFNEIHKSKMIQSIISTHDPLVFSNLPKMSDSLKVAFYICKYQKHEEIKVNRDADYVSVERVRSGQMRWRHLSRVWG